MVFLPKNLSSFLSTPGHRLSVASEPQQHRTVRAGLPSGSRSLGSARRPPGASGKLNPDEALGLECLLTFLS